MFDGSRSVFWAMASVILVAVGVALVFFLRPVMGDTQLVVERIQGSAVIVADGVESYPQTGDVLPAGAVLSTDDGSVWLRSGPSTQVRVDPSTTVRVVAVGEAGLELDLASGRIQATVRGESGALRVGAFGKQVMATHAEFVLAASEDGHVDLRGISGDTTVSGLRGVHMVSAGETVHGFPSGAAVARATEDLLLDVEWPEPTIENHVRLQGTSAPGVKVEVVAGSRIEVLRADSSGQFGIDLATSRVDEALEVRVDDGFGNGPSSTGTLPAQRDPGVRMGVEYGDR